MNELELINEYKSIQYALTEQENKDELLHMERNILETMWNNYKNLIYSTCLKINKYEANDLASVGIISLKYAMEKFDSTKGSKFSTYFTWVLMRDLANENSYNGVYIPTRMRDLIFMYKRHSVENLDSWLKEILSKPEYKTYNFENTKNAILKYSNMKYVVESKSEEFESAYFKQESFEDELIDKLSVPKDVLSDIQKIVGDTYAELFKLKIIDGLTLKDIADKFNCSQNNISIKIKKTVEKLRSNAWFVNKYRELV